MPSVNAQLVADLTQQLHAFFESLDENRYEALLASFAPDARWLRQGRWLEGHAAIRAALQARPATTRVRHVISNLQVEAEQDGEVALRCYLTALRQVGDAAPALFRLNLVSCVYRREADGWLLVEQQLVPEFEFQDPRTTS